uniref:Ubiquitin-like protease family profile domain-containing protein n=1 Tax=Setaria viridis TaxID=4556 RepID=A0A4U6TJJ9_SETVI|nr:hypothetical protein SEVIR_8G251600v2 [Setaria viridis]
MESSDTVPLQSEGVQQGSPRIYSTRRTDTCQRLVNRMPINPKLAVFESTQERFEVLLRPELRSSYPVGGGPGSSFQQLPNRNVPQQSYVPDDPGADFIADDHDPGCNKSVHRMRNASDDRTGVVDRRRKKFRFSHRSSKEKNSAADNSRRLTDYFLAQDGTEAPPRPRNFNVGLDDMTNVPKIRIPRLHDLLSRPLGCLTGHPLQAFNELFDQFDQTLSENTCAIQASLCNIARAPYRLAEKCGPVIEELIAAQRSASDPNNIGETSRRNNSGIEEDFVDPHNDQLFEHGNGGVFRTPSSCYRDDVLRDGNGQNSYTTDPATSKTGGTTPCTKPHQEACRDDHARTTTCSGLHYNMQLSGLSYTPSSSLPDSNHDMNRINNLIDAIYCEEQSNPMHTLPASRTTQFEDQAKTDQNNMVSGTLHVSEQRIGKRMTRKPAKYSSPFKYGIMSRPAPNVDTAMSLFGHMCADDSTLKSYDDYWIRPECHGYRIFFDADLSAILNVEWHKRDSSEPKYSQFAAVIAIQCCLPFTDLKKTKMILLPVLHQHHWSVYCVNFGQSRIDVLDSMLYTPESDNNWDKYHLEFGKKIMHRLSDALSIAAPLKFKSFKNWRHVPVKVPVQKASSDSAFFAMKFLEFYDGDGHGSLHTSIAAERSKELRAETLYYLTFHKQNKVVALPDEILQCRRDDHHPFFY